MRARASWTQTNREMSRRRQRYTTSIPTPPPPPLLFFCLYLSIAFVFFSSYFFAIEKSTRPNIFTLTDSETCREWSRVVAEGNLHQTLDERDRKHLDALWDIWLTSASSHSWYSQEKLFYADLISWTRCNFSASFVRVNSSATELKRRVVVTETMLRLLSIIVFWPIISISILKYTDLHGRVSFSNQCPNHSWSIEERTAFSGTIHTSLAVRIPVDTDQKETLCTVFFMVTVNVLKFN